MNNRLCSCSPGQTGDAATAAAAADCIVYVQSASKRCRSFRRIHALLSLSVSVVSLREAALGADFHLPMNSLRCVCSSSLTGTGLKIDKTLRRS